jgi:hypothetical protein
LESDRKPVASNVRACEVEARESLSRPQGGLACEAPAKGPLHGKAAAVILGRCFIGYGSRGATTPIRAHASILVLIMGSWLSSILRAYFACLSAVSASPRLSLTCMRLLHVSVCNSLTSNSLSIAPQAVCADLPLSPSPTAERASGNVDEILARMRLAVVDDRRLTVHHLPRELTSGPNFGEVSSSEVRVQRGSP